MYRSRFHTILNFKEKVTTKQYDYKYQVITKHDAHLRHSLISNHGIDSKNFIINCNGIIIVLDNLIYSTG